MVRLLVLCFAVIAAAPAFGVDFRWVSGFGQGIVSAGIQNHASSVVEFSCDQGGFQPGSASLYVRIKGQLVQGSRLYQFVIDGRNRPVVLINGSLHRAVARPDKAALMNIAHSLVESRSTAFTVELPELRLEERFSLLNVRDALGAKPGETLADCKGLR